MTGWGLQSPPVSFYPTHDRGPGYTTRCFGVTFEGGTTRNFSMDYALRAIAGYGFLLLRNRPTKLLPSMADIKQLFK